MNNIVTQRKSPFMSLGELLNRLQKHTIVCPNCYQTHYRYVFITNDAVYSPALFSERIEQQGPEGALHVRAIKRGNTIVDGANREVVLYTVTDLYHELYNKNLCRQLNTFLNVSTETA